ncbi:SDR family oxidoreductase [Haloplanus halobius]|uniref:SDR family oxidoreductase n=1 Tax=Haloplanus halobius TaxID=2934938 RepID=UPI00200FD6C8|nr:SDR family oxidoreductase [Haloplanus sp. XH21]
MRVLITGGAGFVGRKLVSHLSEHGHQVVATYHTNTPDVEAVETHKLDVRDRTEVGSLIEEVSPDAVVHAAALVDADACEQDPDLAREVNVEGTDAVVRTCERIDAKIVLFSSSFVFSGGERLYVEDSTRDPINTYGETKVDAEDIVRDAAVPSLVVRIDQPYGWCADWQSPSMIEWVLDGLQGSGSLEVFTDWYNNPVYNGDVAACIQLLLEGQYDGVYHVVGPEYISRYRWARRIAAIFGYDVDRIVPSLSSDVPLPATRPNAKLSSTRLVERTGYAPKGIYDGLRCMRETRPELSNG